MGWRNGSEFKWYRLHDQDGHHAHIIMVKTFKNLLLRNQKADDLETWYAVFGTQVLQNLSK